MKSGIYKIRNLSNDKCYVGSAANVFKRWRVHKCYLKSNKHRNVHLQRAWNRHGEQNFVFEVIEEVQDKIKLIEREQYYLDALRPEYNICAIAGSCLGIKRSAEVKQKMSEAKKGEKHPFYGKTFSEEHRQKMSESKMGEKHYLFGKHLSEETRQKMSEAQKGERHHCFGKHPSEETKQKMSESKKGEKSSSAKLTWEQINDIREKYKIGDCSQYKLAKEYNVSRSCIQSVVENRSWKE